VSETSNTKVVLAAAEMVASCRPFIVYAEDDPRLYFEWAVVLLSTPTLYSCSSTGAGAGAGADTGGGAGGARACCGAYLGGQLNPHGLPFCPVLALLLNALLAAPFVLPTPAPTTYLFSIVVYDIPGNLNRLTPPPLGFVIGVPAIYLLPEPLGPNFATRF
jgi:hypothetical protein